MITEVVVLKAAEDEKIHAVSPGGIEEVLASNDPGVP